MAKIKVRYYDESSFTMDEDGYFRCDHEYVEVEPPCCSGSDCGCYGLYSVYCSDCDNEDLNESEVDDLIEATIPEPPEYEPEEDYLYA